MTTSPQFRFDNPGALIAALPAVLGFVPEKSLVLVGLHDDDLMGAVMRSDLSACLEAGVDRLATLALTSGATRVVAVVVDADGALCPMCNDDHRGLCDALRAALSNCGVMLQAAHVVDRIEAGGRWHCADGCGAAGTVDDPYASPLAAAAVLDGRRLYGRRADLAAVVAPGDAARAAALDARIAGCRERRDAIWRADPNGCARRDVERVMRVAAGVSTGIEPSDDEIAELAAALTDVAVRDTLYGLAVSAQSAAAEALWVTLARALPSPSRAEALVLLAFSAYARGDGPLAGVSLEAALHADPEHRMAGMLDSALQSGMRPEQIRQLAGTGYRVANRLGIRLPPRRVFGSRAV